MTTLLQEKLFFLIKLQV